MPRYCDIVMKGGITSGVVYPLAAVQLAERYRFKNVGGTSAGAIAAAGVAAAEHGRSRGSNDGFLELSRLPAWLGKHMTSLFAPTPATAGLFGIVMSAARGSSGPAKARLALGGAINATPMFVLAGALPGAVLATAVIATASGFTLVFGLVCALLLAGLGLVIGLAAGLARKAMRGMPPNGFGLVSGYSEDPIGDVPPLTTWLADLIDRLAGRTGDALTFGDLWGTRDPTAERDVNLEMMTTCLSQGRPYRLPFESDQFWFWPQEMRTLFPRRIVDQMVRDARPDSRAAEFAPLVPMPAAADLPVVVATRMSLSFPALISAVKLYAIDYSQAVADEDRHPEPCWFSDGGIASNFPVHLFDSPVPRWPTFAIDLRAVPDGWELSDVERENVWMATDNDSKGDEWWTRWDDRGSFGQIAGFATAIFQTMQNWVDSTQSHVQGYRDRVVHIEHSKAEGGMNLAMSKETIAALSERGEWAGDLLRRRFATPPETDSPLTWDNQRWIRYRSFMRLLEDALTKLRTAYEDEGSPGVRTFDELERRDPNDPPDYHWVSDAQRDRATATTAALIALVAEWQPDGVSVAPGSPEPAPEFRVAPRI